jgi:phosphatidate cytidylyltransferase
MHGKRWISGLILAPILILFILYAPFWLFLGLILLLILIGLGEYYALLRPEISRQEKWMGFLLGGVFIFFLQPQEPRLLAAGLIFIFFFLSIRALVQKKVFPLRLEEAGKQALGFLYIPFLLAHFIWMHQMANGRIWILFTLVTVYFGDTAAFYVGRAWGRKKMAPQLSPGKTIEGGLGAVAGSAAGALFSHFLFLPQLPLSHALVLGSLGGLIGQLGDLWESLLKRSAQVKDSGTLIAGHGGLLDRIDSVLFAGPLVYYYLWSTGLA